MPACGPGDWRLDMVRVMAYGGALFWYTRGRRGAEGRDGLAGQGCSPSAIGTHVQALQLPLRLHMRRI